MEPMAEDEELTSTLAEKILHKGTSAKRRGLSIVSEQELDKGLVDAFTRRLCQLLDTEDFFGRHATLSSHEKIERLFLASSEDKTQSDFNCAVSPRVRLQVPMLFQAVAGVMEEKSGAMIQSAAEMNSEGFGRALLYNGRIILVLKSLRAGFPFPFTSQDKAVRYGISCVEEGLAFLEKYNHMTAAYGSFSMEG